MVERATGTLAQTASNPKVSFATGERLLALEVRPRRFAFAVFQGPDLLDWGARSYARGVEGTEEAVEKLFFLSKLYAPAVVIVRQTRRVKGESSKTSQRVLRKIGTELRRHTVRLVIVSRDDVRRFFAQYACHTKHDIASFLANQFPEVRLKLPPRRRPWDPEAHAMAVFDAIGTAVAFNGVSLDHDGR